MGRRFYVYIITNEQDRVLYVGVTSDLSQRVHQHQKGSFQGFTQDYNLHKLLYFEIHDTVEQALAREKQLRSWHRQWKLDLIKESNPRLRDLSGSL